MDTHFEAQDYGYSVIVLYNTKGKMDSKQNLEFLGTFDVVNVVMYIPTYQKTELPSSRGR